MNLDGNASQLTERECEVLQLLAEGKSNREIATQLAIAEITVKNHVSHICEKLHVSNRTHAVVRAMAMGLVPGERGQE